MTDADRRGVRSVETASRILLALARHGQAITLNELARQVDIPAAKCHRYLVSLCDARMVHQRSVGSYDLGTAAAEVGLAAVGRNDLVNQVADDLPNLAQRSGRTAQLSVLGNRGPTVIRWERSARMLVTALGLGSTLPLLTSATGRVFLAFSPRRVTQSLLDAERGNQALDDEQIDRLIAKLRADGLASIDEKLIPGLFAIAAPVLNWQGESDAVVTLVSTEPLDTPTRDLLLKFAANHSF